MDPLNHLAGFLVGVLVGLTGGGGGALMTPLLVFVFGVAPQTAIGTDLLFAAITKGFGGGVHGARGSIDWLVLRRLAAGSLPAAVLTLALLHIFPEEKKSGAWSIRQPSWRAEPPHYCRGHPSVRLSWHSIVQPRCLRPPIHDDRSPATRRA